MIPDAHPAKDALHAGWALYLHVGKQFTGSPADQQLNRVVLPQLVRIWRLYRCVLSLVADGFGPEAESHVRSMQELNASTCWALYNRDVAIERFNLHLKFALHVHQPEDCEALPEEDRRVAAKLFGKYSEKSWTGCSDQALADSLDEFRAAVDAPIAGGIHGPLRRWYSWTIHGTPLTLLRNQTTSAPEGLRLTVGPSESALVDALREAGNQMLLSISLALVYWQQSLTPDLTTKMFDLWCVDVPAARTAERNDPCPCGSGVKFKKCHMPGAPFS